MSVERTKRPSRLRLWAIGAALWAGVLALPSGSSAQSSELSEVLANGDILLQRSLSAQSAALREATGSEWTHTGLAFQRDRAWFVLEAVQPVRWTALDRWVDRGDGGDVIVLRLAQGPPDLAQVAALREAGEVFLGRDYDLLFQWSDDTIYCSELVEKAYQRGLGISLVTPHPMADFTTEGEDVQALIDDRYGARFDPDELVVAPSDLLESPLLVRVRGPEP